MKRICASRAYPLMRLPPGDDTLVRWRAAPIARSDEHLLESQASMQHAQKAVTLTALLGWFRAAV